MNSLGGVDSISSSLERGVKKLGKFLQGNLPNQTVFDIAKFRGRRMWPIPRGITIFLQK